VRDLAVLGLDSRTALHKQQLKAAFHKAAMQVGVMSAALHGAC
jgi:hypothetical protein